MKLFVKLFVMSSFHKVTVAMLRFAFAA